MSRLRALVILAAGVLIGAAADREYRLRRGPHGELAHMAHVGILVRNLDEAVAKFRAMGFDGISVSPDAPAAIEPDRVSHYRGGPLNARLKKAFITGTIPEIELMQPVGDPANPWSAELQGAGEVLHHVAYRVSDAPHEIELLKKTGLVEIADGQWPEAPGTLSTWHYLRDPASSLIVEILSTKRR